MVTLKTKQKKNKNGLFYFKRKEFYGLIDGQDGSDIPEQETESQTREAASF